MRERPYEAEALLQALLAEHPEVLAGGEGESQGWVLVKREAGVSDAEEAGNRWSFDHLFLDADGVPTLVEVKRRPLSMKAETRAMSCGGASTKVSPPPRFQLTRSADARASA